MNELSSHVYIYIHIHMHKYNIFYSTVIATVYLLWLSTYFISCNQSENEKINTELAKKEVFRLRELSIAVYFPEIYDI